MIYLFRSINSLYHGFTTLVEIQNLSLTVEQDGLFGTVKNPSLDSMTPLIPQYSSSSPDAPDTPTAPTVTPLGLVTKVPPGKGAILPPVMVDMLSIWQNLAELLSPVYLSLNCLLD